MDSVASAAVLPSIEEFDRYFMGLALSEARRSAAEGETPLGCVIVEPAVLEPAHDGVAPVFDWDVHNARILGRGRNATEGLQDATAHAEMLAIGAASAARGSRRLSGARLYVTKEPCPMCAGAISLSRLDSVIWGAADPKRGGETVFGILSSPGMNHRPETKGGVRDGESLELLRGFFRERRCERRVPAVP